MPFLQHRLSPAQEHLRGANPAQHAPGRTCLFSVTATDGNKEDFLKVRKTFQIQSSHAVFSRLKHSGVRGSARLGPSMGRQPADATEESSAVAVAAGGQAGSTGHGPNGPSTHTECVSSPTFSFSSG